MKRAGEGEPNLTVPDHDGGPSLVADVMAPPTSPSVPLTSPTTPSVGGRGVPRRWKWRRWWRECTRHHQRRGGGGHVLHAWRDRVTSLATSTTEALERCYAWMASSLMGGVTHGERHGGWKWVQMTVWGSPSRRRFVLLGLATISLAVQALLLSLVASQSAAGHHPTHAHAVLLPSRSQATSRRNRQQQTDATQHVPASAEDAGGEAFHDQWDDLPEMLRDEWSMAHHLSVTLLFELTKLVISSFMLLVSLRDGVVKDRADTGGAHQGPTVGWRWDESRHFLIPAFLYLINDNLLFAILNFVDPATFEVLGNMRILTTSLFYRVVFRQRHRMNQVQWASLVLLCVGTATSQLVTCGNEIISAIPFTGVYLEYLMKRQTEQLNSFHFQNVQLYAYGTLLNAIPLYTYYYKEVNSMGVLMLAGSDLLTAVTVLNHALTGLAMAAIVKYLDNIARVYAHSMSMMITILVSSVWLQRVPSIQFVFGSIIVMISLHLYHLPRDSYGSHPHGDHDDDDDDDDGSNDLADQKAHRHREVHDAELDFRFHP